MGNPEQGCFDSAVSPGKAVEESGAARRYRKEEEEDWRRRFTILVQFLRSFLVKFTHHFGKECMSGGERRMDGDETSPPPHYHLLTSTY